MDRKSNDILTLPISVVGRVDVGRLLREVEATDGFLAQAAIREPGTPMKLPKTSRLLDETIQSNKLNMLVEDDRNRLLHFLMEVYAHAPVLHMSFSADPTPAFTQKLTSWLRAQVHPMVLLQIGLQPNIGAGCTVRTTNKYFDFSLRNRLHERRDMMLKSLKEAAGLSADAPANTNEGQTGSGVAAQPMQVQPVVVTTAPSGSPEQNAAASESVNSQGAMA